MAASPPILLQRNMELPHTSSGETDWNTLGNILTAKILGEVLCASYVDRAYGQRSRSKVFEPDTDWKFMYKEDGVVAFQKSFKDSPIKAFMGRGVIDRPMEDIVHYLEDHERRKEWDRYLVAINQVKAMSENDFILHMRLMTGNCLVKYHGDFVQYERMAYVDEKYVRTVVSVELPEFPVRKSVIRGELHPGTGWVLEPYNGSRSRTLVSFLAHVDLKLPAIVVNRVMRRQPKAIHRIRKILMSPRRRAQSLGSYSPDPESLCDSFTASETRAIVAATTEDAPSQLNPWPDLSIDEYIGRPERRFQSNAPVLRYHHETDSYLKKTRIGRSVSVDSAPKSAYGSARLSFERGESSDNGFGTPASFKSLDADRLHPQMPGGVAQGATQAVNVVELPIDSNPVVAESTGFRGDSQLPFFTPSSSMDNGTGGDENADAAVRCNGRPKGETEDCENATTNSLRV